MLAELDAAIRNRAAEAGIFVFAKRQQAPLDGRALRVYSGNRFAIVFDKMTKTTKIRSRSKPSAEWPAEFSSPSSTNKHRNYSRRFVVGQDSVAVQSPGLYITRFVRAAGESWLGGAVRS